MGVTPPPVEKERKRTRQGILNVPNDPQMVRAENRKVSQALCLKKLDWKEPKMSLTLPRLRVEPALPDIGLHCSELDHY